MYSNVESGATNRATEFVRTLGQLKLTGCNLLLVGRVPDDVLTAASRKLLGDVSERRARLLVLTGSRRADLQERLPAADYPRSAAEPASQLEASVLAYADGERALEIEDTTATRTDVDGSLSALATAVGEEIDAVESATGDLEPAQLRLCFDSLESLVADHDIAEVETFLDEVTEQVAAVNGMAHYVLPVERDHPTVARLGSHFDATIEYRTAEGGQERWHFPGSDLSTTWFPLR